MKSQSSFASGHENEIYFYLITQTKAKGRMSEGLKYLNKKHKLFKESSPCFGLRKEAQTRERKKACSASSICQIVCLSPAYLLLFYGILFYVFFSFFILALVYSKTFD